MKQFKQDRHNPQAFVIIGSNIGFASHTKEMKESLDALELPSRVLNGVYVMENGDVINEESFIVPYTTKKEYIMLLSLAMHFKQENILVADETRQAKLVYINSKKEEELGKITPLTEKEFILLDSKYKTCYSKDEKYYYVTI